jgi:hypothetical protein
MNHFILKLFLVLTFFLLIAPTAPAQEALRSSLAGDAAAEAQRRADMEMPFTIKTGDFRLLLTPSFNQYWNDNINLVSSNPQSDFILQPMLGLSASYPLTSRNVLRLNTAIGYDFYLEHPQYSGVRVLGGSELSFDAYVQDFRFNVHDRFQYTQNPSTEASVANTADYGGLDNFAGGSVLWDLQDVVLTLGYDHENFVSSTAQYDYLTRASELLVSRAGFRFHPAFIAGIEGTGSLTTYEQNTTLNNNDGYSAGVYGDWQPGHHTHVQLRGGYTEYFFQQAGPTLPAFDANGWYADLTVNQDITETISYSISAGHELRLGIQANNVEDWYVRPRVSWKLLKDLTFITSLGYETGQQLLATQPPSSESYGWFWFGFDANYGLTKKLMVGLTYRFTDRASNLSSRGYAQNLVGLRLSYLLQ